MTNLYLYLDKRAPRKDGTCPLKAAVSRDRATAYHSLEIYVRPDEWDKDNERVVKREDKKFLNVLIRKRKAEMTLVLQRILLRDDAEGLTCRQIMDMCARGTDTVERPEDSDYVVPVYNEYVALARKAATAASYRSSLRNLEEFARDVDTLRFRDVTVAWLRRYQKWLVEERGMGVNGANVYMRNLRTVFNFALRNEYTKARYPFRDVDMTTTEPDKTGIAWDKFLEWATIPMDDRRQFYRDLFLLSFFLCGIRPVDLLHARKDQVVDGRLVYWPEKLNGRTKLSIKIEPEAWEIIRRYEGSGEYLLNVLDGRGDYRAFMQHWNRALKAVGKDLYTPTRCGNGKTYQLIRHVGVVPYITVYYARTCWASYAYNMLEVSMDVISQALGHKNGLRVTNFYVKRGNDKVDRANRALIDLFKAAVAERAASGA